MSKQFKIQSTRTPGSRSHVDWDRGVITLRKPGHSSHPIDYSELVYAHPKRDGIRVCISRDPADSRARVFTSVGHDLSESLRHCVWYDRAQLELPHAVLIDAELCVPGHGREMVKRYVAQRHKDLAIKVFAITNCATVHNVMLECKTRYGFDIDMFVASECASLGDVPQPEYDGYVLRSMHTYGEWIKMKHRRTVDCVVTGVQLGVGKYWGMVGSLRCSLGSREIANVSGMNDATREEATTAHRAKELLGRVCEVAYERVGSQGRLQHPRFIAWRWDKLPEDCTEEQLRC